MLGWLIDQVGYLVVYGGAGLLIGWNALPQPEIVRRAYAKIAAFVKEKFSK